MRALYTLSIRTYTLLIHIAALFLPKAKQWVSGRKKWQAELATINPSSLPLYWFHFASLGEFEQGRPLMEALKKEQRFFLLITFFSPSGYAVRKDYAIADKVMYLPPDLPKNTRLFIEQTQPKMAFFIKYEFWFNYLSSLARHGIPTYLVSGIFRPKQHFFKWYGAWFRKQLSAFTHFFVQNDASATLLQSIGYNNCTISGDTRFDRVKEIANQTKSFPLIADFSENHKVFIVGSNWQQDDELLMPFINGIPSGYKVIMAPHNIKATQLEAIENALELPAQRYSEVVKQNRIASETRVLIIDAIGFLSHLYQYGHIAYIGGGFGANVHNILEAATYGLPTIFGPNYHKFDECVTLVREKGAFSIKNRNEFEAVWNQLQETTFYNKASSTANNYVNTNAGGTQRIMSQLALARKS
jgi:3-deoxy-D-manno-octulosonic-acid transferase